MSRKNEAITISCTPAEKTSLEAIAEKYGFMWGPRPNISAFLKAIANGAIQLQEPSPDLKLKAEIADLEAQLRQKKSKLK